MGFEKLKERWAREREKQIVLAGNMKERLLDRGIPIFKKFGVQKVILFGSVANGYCGERSDLDILVLPLPSERYWDFRYDLEEAVDIPLDIYTESDDPVFIKKILSRGEVIYEI
ncbi:nucleotidyltransferase domain-containing protein [candidate division KSB1 bacterium]|nr:nucleotidyltransferase domain-containing protein [candidate division KSB1 bacterium]